MKAKRYNGKISLFTQIHSNYIIYKNEGNVKDKFIFQCRPFFVLPK